VISLFSYGILRFLGYIDGNTHMRFTSVPSTKKKTDLFGCEGQIAYLHRANLHSRVLELLEGDYYLKRIISFAQNGGNPQTKTLYKDIISTLRKRQTTNTSREALTEAFLLVVRLKEKNGDIWKSAEAIEAFVEKLKSLNPYTLPISYPTDKRYMDLPVFKPREGVRTEDDITGSFKVVLEEGKILELQEKHITIVIGGPSGSGKSTLAASLVSEMRNVIRSLQTRQGFENLKLDVGLLDLDLATPAVTAIEGGWATDRERMERTKRPWTTELAKEAQKNLIRARAKYNITVGDLPGGKIDYITELLTASGDVGIIITNDWEILTKNWVPLMMSAGVPVASKIKSRKTGDGVSSLVTQMKEGEILMGRISSLSRQHKSWDLFIQWLALFLLFDMLPAKFKAGS